MFCGARVGWSDVDRCLGAPMKSLNVLLGEIRKCDTCKDELPLGPRPTLAAHAESRILIVGQAPGVRVHKTGIAWNDPSGERLRHWTGISTEDFYDCKKVALVPMGFCYPGSGKQGDLPPRPECSELWHPQLFPLLNNVRLTLLVGQYSQKFMLKNLRKSNLTKTVQAWREFAPERIPLPHPSPRNNRWLKKNPWFEKDVVPYLRQRVKRLLEK